MCAVGNILLCFFFALSMHRGRDRDGGRRKGGDDGEHYSSRDGFKKRKRSDSSSYNSNDSRTDRSYDRHHGR